MCVDLLLCYGPLPFRSCWAQCLCVFSLLLGSEFSLLIILYSSHIPDERVSCYIWLLSCCYICSKVIICYYIVLMVGAATTESSTAPGSVSNFLRLIRYLVLYFQEKSLMYRYYSQGIHPQCCQSQVIVVTS